jgi:hypothetical protein
MEAAEQLTVEDVERLAGYVGMQLWNDAGDTRNGRYRIVRGRDILHHAEDLEDAAGWLSGWLAHVG